MRETLDERGHALHEGGIVRLQRRDCPAWLFCRPVSAAPASTAAAGTTAVISDVHGKPLMGGSVVARVPVRP